MPFLEHMPSAATVVGISNDQQQPSGSCDVSIMTSFCSSLKNYVTAQIGAHLDGIMAMQQQGGSLATSDDSDGVPLSRQTYLEEALGDFPFLSQVDWNAERKERMDNRQKAIEAGTLEIGTNINGSDAAAAGGSKSKRGVCDVLTDKSGVKPPKRAKVALASASTRMDGRCICSYGKRCKDILRGFKGTGHAYDRNSIGFRKSKDPLWSSFEESLIRSLQLSPEEGEKIKSQPVGSKIYVCAHHFAPEAVAQYINNKKGLWKVLLEEGEAMRVLNGTPLDACDMENGKYRITANYPMDAVELQLKGIQISSASATKVSQNDVVKKELVVSKKKRDTREKREEGACKEKKVYHSKCICRQRKCKDVQKGFEGTGHAYDRPPFRFSKSNDPLWLEYEENLLRNLNVSQEMREKIQSMEVKKRFVVCVHHFTPLAITRYLNESKPFKEFWKVRLDQREAEEVVHMPLLDGDERDMNMMEDGTFVVAANFPLSEAELLLNDVKLSEVQQPLGIQEESTA